ncbi:MAG: hypothetical protein E3K40_04490 [Candidatus Brocadia sp.]|nr:hypothetical protein [Candidatus Brocadia sp.]
MDSQFITDESENKTAVILSLKDYEELLEDIHDLTVIAERKNEPAINLGVKEFRSPPHNPPVYGGKQGGRRCDIQNLSSIGASCKTQKQHTAPMELDYGIMVCL